MEDTKCTSCGTVNHIDNSICTNCGYVIIQEKQQMSQISTADTSRSGKSTSMSDNHLSVDYDGSDLPSVFEYENRYFSGKKFDEEVSFLRWMLPFIALLIILLLGTYYETRY